MSVCPCGGIPAGASYEQCCEPALTNQQWPKTAEALMRSRYTAFELGHEDHVFRTWHPSTRPPEVSADPGTEWLGLTIHSTEAGGEQDESGVVEFTARYLTAGRGDSQREVSLFRKRADRWMYVAAMTGDEQ
ncbi:YchJ family protein [Kocuria sp. cx-455]|uniref:YchJ family protein n=1 Tax=Kocuria sp. cx-455 TaxID=2771377 RepID=UPI003D711F8F